MSRFFIVGFDRVLIDGGDDFDYLRISTIDQEHLAVLDGE